METPTSVGVQAKLGYLSEYITAFKLTELIVEHGHDNQFHHIQDLYQSKLDELLKLNPPKDEIDRMHRAGVQLANNIFDDFHDKSSRFFIEHNGTAEMGNTKSDIRVYNDSQRIDASLKVYKSYNINILGTTFISIFKKLFHSGNESLPTKTEDYINYFCSIYGNEKYLQFQSLLNHQYSVKNNLQNGHSKQIARKYFKQNHNQIMHLFKDIFEHYYHLDIPSVNGRLLKLLGLEGSDHIYACVGKKNPKVFSSNTNLLFKDKVSKLNNLDFIVNVDVHLNGGFMKFFNGNDELLNIRMSITDSGCSNGSPQGKFNSWLNFKQFM